MAGPLALLYAGLIGTPSALAGSYVPSSTIPPNPQREFRGVWVATVANIDWPSKKNLSVVEQKSELLAILDRAKELRLNAVIFQVRPACDALYASRIEPWSEYLTGAMGRAPKPFYDPLAFAVEEAHKRGLELHAWFNPYRARHFSAESPAPASHITKSHPQLVHSYGKYLWLDPGEKEVQDYSLSVVMDVVWRYDIDGIHFDDYFYPYKEKGPSGADLDFPDAASWEKFGAGGKLNRDDWRRENVNVFIRRVYESIKAAKPWVKFGVSPFGIWRPGYPAQIRGYDSFAKLYADSRKWLASGWLDYFVPQLYWAIEPPEQSFPVLLKWWTEQNSKGRNIYAGLDVTKVGNQWQPAETINQIHFVRAPGGGAGEIHWNANSLIHNTKLDVALERDVYAEPALAPASPWLGRATLEKPRLNVNAGRSHPKFEWSAGMGDEPWLWIVQTRKNGHWTTRIVARGTKSITWSGPLPEVVAVSGVDRNGNPSQATAVELQK